MLVAYIDAYIMVIRLLSQHLKAVMLRKHDVLKCSTFQLKRNSVRLEKKYSRKLKRNPQEEKKPHLPMPSGL